MTDKKLLMTMLFDFYGELLTDKQREYYDLFHNEDLSLSEIAEQVGITRQGVYDIITRAEHTLLAIEDKTGLISRYNEMRADILLAAHLADEIQHDSDGGPASEKARELGRLLTSLKGQVTDGI